ncbi:MAG: tetratricopeptide repeat protein [Steroidobacteraceae bacterium]
MVYLSSMIPVLAALLLSATTSPQAVAETAAPAPPPAAAAESTPPPAPGAAAPAPAFARPPASQAPATILALDPRMEAYEQFRAHYDTAHFEEALPFARRVVELSETDPELDYELPIAYNNLGATLYQLGDYKAAEANYVKSLEVLEATQGISSRRLIVPLAGLGAVYAATDQHTLAAQLLDRAIAVSRRSNGLFNLAQLPLLEQVADSRYAINDFNGVERERLYTLKIAEQNFGYDDERTLPAILKLADFYEELREYIAARLMYLRARDIAMKESAGYSPMAVRSLVGIARTHRLQYTMDPQTLESQQPGRDPITGEIVRYNGEVIGKSYDDSRVPPPAADRNGLRAAQLALELLRATPDPPRNLLLQTLIELGDWYQSTSRPAIALPYYTEAAALLAAAPDEGLGNPLLVPRMIYYKPPISAQRGLNTLTGQYIIRKAFFSFDVTEAGETENITVVKTDMSDAQLSHSRRSISRAIYSPRFVDGKPVATQGVSFTADWYEEHDPAKATPATVPVPGSEPAQEPPVSTAGG